MFRALTLILTLSFTPLWAETAPHWIDTPPVLPNVRMLVHDGAAAKTSFVAVQVGDARAAKLFEELSAKGEALDRFLPHRCFELRRDDLQSRQTWCKSVGGALRVFVESGPNEMPRAAFADLAREILGSAK